MSQLFRSGSIPEKTLIDRFDRHVQERNTVFMPGIGVHTG
jgi:hypothetical protein